MSLRLYFRPTDILKNAQPRLRYTGRTKSLEVDNLMLEYNAGTFQPSSWHSLYYLGCQFRWDSNYGMPYLEYTRFFTELPHFCYADDVQLRVDGYSHLSIIDSWEGSQQPCIWRALKPVDEPCTAILCRRNGSLHLELGYRGFPCKIIVVYEAIRKGDASEYFQLVDNIDAK